MSAVSGLENKCPETLEQSWGYTSVMGTFRKLAQQFRNEPVCHFRGREVADMPQSHEGVLTHPGSLADDRVGEELGPLIQAGSDLVNELWRAPEDGVLESVHRFVRLNVYS